MRSPLPLLVVVIAGLAAEDCGAADLKRQAEEVFQWLDGLGLPSIGNQPFVEVTAESPRG